MTEEQTKLNNIVQARRCFMMKTWETAECDFSYKTFVEVKFFNSDSDFRTTRYPCIEEAIEKQQEKLSKDIAIRAGKKEYMDEVYEAMV